jgi:CubicO group peptidase (beta-lactamase class C family)
MTSPAWWHEVAEAVHAEHVAQPSNLPGAAFGVQTLDGGPLTGSVGESWADDTICAIFSMSKVFTATALLVALEEHRLFNIEMPVCRFPGMEGWADDRAKSQIRVRHLLQHTSGLPAVKPAAEWPRSTCNDPGAAPSCPHPKLDLGPTAPWIGAPGITNECVCVGGRCLPARTLSLDEVSHHVMSAYQLIAEPGAQFSYATSNLIVAGRMIEQLTGDSVNRYIKEKIFAPLGMRDSFFVAGPTGDAVVDARIGEGVTAEQRARIAPLVNITQDGRLPAETAPGPDGVWDRFRSGWRFVYPDGGMYSTVADLLTFLRMLRDRGRASGKQILSPVIVRLLTKDQGFNHTMGLGFRPQTTPYGQGVGTLEHLGHAMTYFWYDPHPGNPLIGVFLSQRLPNVAVNINMGDGMKVIFRVFLPAVKRGVLGETPPQQAARAEPAKASQA